MSLWIPVTLAAALFQTVRFMLQKSLSTVRLSPAGATFARFAYSAPFILTGLGAYLWFSGRALPALSGTFWLFAVIGGTAQILATICVVALFKQRNFAVGITFKKTEVIQTAIVGFLVLGEGVSAGGMVAILLGLLAVLVLSRTPDVTGAWWRHLTGPASLLGLASGVLFAISSVTYRGASLELAETEPVLRAAITLAAVVGFQLLSMAIYLAWRDRDQLRAVWQTRGTGVFVGLTSMGGSFCWFLAFTLQNAAYVKALGQVELVFSLLASILFFRETITAREISGMALLGLSILALVLAI
ncbi:EamA-like transporter family protein [Cribrihabitans marinus]|uniref:EamA-like transporter family protein n=1 Tax=Cribrihabitans marinus TaxID=1227549 RepID=A0A1H6ZWE5_9RHOB|nr:DMT family transporter [Cribrihabitans marinus]GGH29886.1 membrane protein [Cribrihabitans marinus]SEJ57548.1 EamA-like transporter family protein [Cribrihabitans marinus]